MSALVFKLSQFAHNNDQLFLEIQGNERGMAELYQQLALPRGGEFLKAGLKVSFSFDRITDEYFSLHGQFCFVWKQACDSCGQITESKAEASVSGGASPKPGEAELYPIKNKELSLVPILLERVLLAMPHTVACSSCDVELDPEDVEESSSPVYQVVQSSQNSIRCSFWGP